MAVKSGILWVTWANAHAQNSSKIEREHGIACGRRLVRRKRAGHRRAALVPQWPVGSWCC